MFKLDRQGIQHPRLPCQIIKIYEKTGFFEIASSAGIIDCKFRGGDLTKYNGELNINLKKKVCLRNTAIFFNGGHLNSKVSKKKALIAIEKAAKTKKKTNCCNCKVTDCGVRSNCSCQKNGLKCNSHCNCKKKERLC